MDNYTETGAAPKRRVNGGSKLAKGVKETVEKGKGKERDCEASALLSIVCKLTSLLYSHSESGEDANDEWLAFSIFRNAHRSEQYSG